MTKRFSAFLIVFGGVLVLIFFLMGLKVHVVLIFMPFSGFCFLHFNLVYNMDGILPI